MPAISAAASFVLRQLDFDIASGGRLLDNVLALSPQDLVNGLHPNPDMTDEMLPTFGKWWDACVPGPDGP
jgi:hypothetical protein